MTYSESKFRKHVQRIFNDSNIYIKKLPDKRQGTLGNIGMPDYIVITNTRTLWFEVKLSHAKHTFNLDLISESQYIEFNKMHKAGAIIIIAVYMNDILYLVPYMHIHFAKFISGDISVDNATLDRWSVKEW